MDQMSNYHHLRPEERVAASLADGVIAELSRSLGEDRAHRELARLYRAEMATAQHTLTSRADPADRKRQDGGSRLQPRITERRDDGAVERRPHTPRHVAYRGRARREPRLVDDHARAACGRHPGDDASLRGALCDGDHERGRFRVGIGIDQKHPHHAFRSWPERGPGDWRAE